MAKMYLQEKLPDGQNNGDVLAWKNGAWTAMSEFDYFFETVDYIESSGSQHIDTEYSPNSTVDIELEMYFDASQSNYAYAFGSYVNNDAMFTINASSESAYGNICEIYRPRQYSTNIDARGHKIKVKTSGANVKVYIDDSLYGEYDYTQSLSDNLSSAYLFWCSGVSSSSIRKVAGKLFYCKFWDNGTLVRDYVPCYRKSDKVIGLYDKVGKQFYINQGSGSFTCYPSPT